MKRRQIYILIGFIIGAAFIGFRLTQEGEPEYKGKKLSAWLAAGGQKVVPDEDIGESDEQKAATAEAIRAIGTNALPSLIKWIQWQAPSPSKLRAVAMINKMPRPISRSIMSSAVGTWLAPNFRVFQAVEGFQILGTNASSAAPELIQMIERPKRGQEPGAAIYALGSIGTKGLPLLVEILNNRTNSQRSIAASALGLIPDLGTNAMGVVKLLVGCTREDDQFVASGAVWALGRLQAEPNIAVPALIVALESTNQAVQMTAIQSLEKFRGAARPAIPALLKAAQHPERFGGTALSAVRTIAPELRQKGAATDAERSGIESYDRQ